MNREQIDKIQELLGKGYSRKEIADKLGSPFRRSSKFNEQERASLSSKKKSKGVVTGKKPDPRAIDEIEKKYKNMKKTIESDKKLIKRKSTRLDTPPRVKKHLKRFKAMREPEDSRLEKIEKTHRKLVKQEVKED